MTFCTKQYIYAAFERGGGTHRIPNNFDALYHVSLIIIGLYTFSHNSKYANCEQGQWIEKSNPGLNMMFEDWGFPMSIISHEDDLTSIKQVFLICYYHINFLNLSFCLRDFWES